MSSAGTVTPLRRREPSAPAAIDVAPTRRGDQGIVCACILYVTSNTDSVTQAGKDDGSVRTALFRGIITAKPSSRGRRLSTETVELGTEEETQSRPSPASAAGILEEELVEHRILGPRHERRRWPLVAKPPRAEWRAERDNGAEAVGTQKRRLPCYRGADVVAGDHRLLGTQSVDQTHDVADVMKDRIFLRLLRTVASAIATQVRGHRTEAAFASAGS